MAAQAQQNTGPTMADRMKIVQLMAVYPAITLMVFMRRKVGFRMLKPARLIAMFMVLIVIRDIFGGFSHDLGFAFNIFPTVMLGFGFFQRWRRWTELCRGERWHTYSPGISYLEVIPLPAFLTSCRRVYRFIEPLLCYILGCIVVHLISPALGRWICFSAFALFIFEQTLFERQLDHDLDILDGLVAAEVQAETSEHFAGPEGDEKRRNLDATAGIPTGVAYDIHRNIERRMAKQAEKDRLTKEPPPVRPIVQVNVVATSDRLAPLPRPALDNMVKDEPEGTT